MRKRSIVRLGTALCALALSACAERTPAPPTERVGSFTVNGLKLEYVDWGGEGVPIVMLAGALDSPLQFLPMVPELRRQHRVVGLTRRGHGGSEMPTGPFGIDDLVDDVRQLLDSLGIERAILLGLSFGGQEITRVAEVLPERVLGLVYVDATFGWDDSLALGRAMAALPEGVRSPAEADMASWERFLEYYRTVEYGETPWTPEMERHVRAIARIGPDGRVSLPAEGVGPSIIGINVTYRRDYAALRVPVLAFVGDRLMPRTALPDSVVAARVLDWEREHIVPLREEDLLRLQAAVPGARIVRLPGQSHSQVAAGPSPEVTSEILTFTRGIKDSP